MEKSVLSLPEFEAAKNYWVDNLGGVIFESKLPFDFSGRDEYVQSDCRWGFDQESRHQLGQVCKNQDLALYIFLLTGFKILLHKFTNTDDIIVSSPVFIKNGKGSEFNQWVLFRDLLPEEMTGKELLLNIKQTVLKGYKYQHYPVERILEFLDVNPLEWPTFCPMLILEPFHGSGLVKKGMDSHPFSLVFSLVRGNDSLDGNIIFDAMRFSMNTVERLAKAYQLIIKQLLFHSDRKLKEINAVPEDEQSQILYEFNHAITDYDKNKLLHQLFEEQVDQTPHLPAIVFNHQEVTYADLDKQANRIGNFLLQQNVKSDQLIGILSDDPLKQIIAILGILKSGCAYVPVDLALPWERMKTIISDAGIKIIISDKKNISLLNKLQWECGELNTYLCMDSGDVHCEPDTNQNQLMTEKLWEYIGETATDEIKGGGWTNSFTGRDLSPEEMAEYSDNVLHKLKPYLDRKPRILEIGCASGLSMFKISPFASFYYGTDLSKTIIERNQSKVFEEQIPNIKLQSLPAHNIDQLEETGFDIVIMNSVIQCFHGYNYLRKIIGMAIHQMNNYGVLFIGDVMDQDLKFELQQSLLDFQRLNPNSRTKTDLSNELFVPKAFFTDLAVDIKEIKKVHFSAKIHSIENELTKYRYDVIIELDKIGIQNNTRKEKHKYQYGSDALQCCGDKRVITHAGPDNLAYIIYTSGSTGKPKGVMIEQGSISKTIQWRRAEYQLSRFDNVLQLFSYSFDGFLTSFFTPIVSGAKVILLNPDEVKDPAAIKDCISENQVTHFICVPILFRAILDEASPSELASLRVVTLAGDKVTPDIIAKSKEKNKNLELVNEYGPTENTVVSTILRNMIPDKTISIGKPVPNTKIYILDQNYQLQPIGVPGEIYLSGDRLSKGYLNLNQLTSEKFIDNPFENNAIMYKSGDLARWLPDGNIEFIGRIDDQVKIRGYRIELGEIEAQILKHESIQQTIVIAREDRNHNNNLFAYFVAEQELTVTELRAFLAQTLPDYMIPLYFVQLTEIPLNSNGKIDRKILPEPEESINTNLEYVTPRDEMETKLANLWLDILELDRIGINHNFFEMGGHSLKATVLSSRVHKIFNLELPLSEIFKKPTIREQAEYLREAAATLYVSIPPVIHWGTYPDGVFPVSSAQKRLYILNQMEGIGTSYNLPSAIVIEGELDQNRLETIFKELIKRHESFQTTFELRNGEPVQRIQATVDFEMDCWESEENGIADIFKRFFRPFDLTVAPLFRAGLIKLAAAKHLLIYDMHHIISDGISLSLLIREFIDIYEGKQLPQLRIQYKDYAVWQHQLIQNGDLKAQEQYWRNCFSGEIPVLNLPVDYPRPTIQSFAGDRMGFEVGGEIARKINQIAAKTGATTYMVLLTVFNILLSKYSGQEDIIVGSPVSGRPHTDLEKIIGMFVNTLAMRNYPAGTKTFREFLLEVKENALQAYENQAYQFEDLVEILALRRDLSRNPLFDVMFVFQNIDFDGRKVKDIQFRPYANENKVAKFDLTFIVVEMKENIIFNFEYCTKLFKPESIMRLSGHMQNILQAVTMNLELKLAEVEMLSETEKQQILYDFNTTEAEYPKDKTIHELFAQQAQRTPDKIAVEYEGQTITYREFNELVQQCALFLEVKGVHPGTVVGITGDHTPETVVGILGILQAGGTYLPVEPGYPPERIKYMLEDSGAQFFITGQDLHLTGIDTIRMEDIITVHPEKAGPTQRSSPQDMAYIIYTSGSTGQPKGVPVSHRGLVNYIWWARKVYLKGQALDFPLYSSLSFDLTITSIFTPLISGGKIIIYQSADKLGLIRRIITEDKVGIIKMTPTHLKVLDNLDVTNQHLQKIIVGGEDLKTDLAWRIDHKFGGRIEIFNEYGPTETVVGCMIYQYDPRKDRRNSVPIGVPADNVQIYLLDRYLKPVPVNVDGEIYISGDGVASGYINRRELTAAKFIANPFKPGERMYRTGDLARWLSDGNIEFLGRMDHQVKIRGFRIELSEIEAELLKYEAIKETIVIAKEDENLGKYLCAYVTADREITVKELRNYLANRLPDYMIPSYFVQLEKMPFTPNGKIDHKQLPESEGRMNSGVEYIMPQTELEKTLAGIWKEILQNDRIGLNDNFFDMGGNSLLIIKLQAVLESYYPNRIKVIDLFTYPTIDKLAQYLTRQSGAQEKPAVISKQNPDSRDFDRQINEMFDALEEGKLSTSQFIEKMTNGEKNNG